MNRMMGVIGGVVLGAVMIAAFSGAAFAANPTDVTVNATVQQKCVYTMPALGATTLNMGILDPETAGAASAFVDIANAVKCTKGYAFNATMGTGLYGANNLQEAGGDRIPYTPSYTCRNGGAAVACTGRGFGGASAIDVRVTVDIAAGVYADSTGGAYSDTFTVTLAP